MKKSNIKIQNEIAEYEELLKQPSIPEDEKGFAKEEIDRLNKELIELEKEPDKKAITPKIKKKITVKKKVKRKPKKVKTEKEPEKKLTTEERVEKEKKYKKRRKRRLKLRVVKPKKKEELKETEKKFRKELEKKIRKEIYTKLSKMFKSGKYECGGCVNNPMAEGGEIDNNRKYLDYSNEVSDKDWAFMRLTYPGNIKDRIINELGFSFSYKPTYKDLKDFLDKYGDKLIAHYSLNRIRHKILGEEIDGSMAEGGEISEYQKSLIEKAKNIIKPDDNVSIKYAYGRQRFKVIEIKDNKLYVWGWPNAMGKRDKIFFNFDNMEQMGREGWVIEYINKEYFMAKGGSILERGGYAFLKPGTPVLYINYEGKLTPAKIVTDVGYTQYKIEDDTKHTEVLRLGKKAKAGATFEEIKAT